MAVLQRSTKVKMPVDKAEKCWNDFASQAQGAPKSDGNGGGGNGKDPGTVYFTKVDDQTTEVTIQIDPEGIAQGEESQMNQRVDSFLDRFKGYVEK